MLPLGQIIRKQLASTVMLTHSCMFQQSQMTYTSLIKVEECVKNIRHWMLINFVLLNSDKTALLSGCSSRCINKLQLVQNGAARVITRTRRYDHITPILSILYWLPVKCCLDYKILLLTYKALNGLTPQYLSELLRSKGAGYLLVP